MNKLMTEGNILVPVDFSDFSRKAFPVATAIASLFKGRITLIHAYELYSDLDGFHYLGEGFRLDGALTEIEEELKQKLKHFAFAAGVKESSASVVVVQAPPYRAIVEQAEKCDLVVMSSHGRSGFSRFFMGSVAEKVLRLSNRPVVVVEDESGFEPIKKILVTTDFSDNSYAAFSYVREIAAATGADINLFHAVSDDAVESEQVAEIIVKRSSELQSLVQRFLPELADRVFPVVEVGGDSAHAIIRNHIERENYNLAVMSTIGRTGLDYLRLGSTTASLVREVKTAVMVVKPN